MNLYEIITGLRPPEMDEALEAFVSDGMAEFKKAWDDNPVKNRSSAIHAADAFWLYWLTKAIAPSIIIESGTHRGFSMCIMRSAAPQARMLTFDPAKIPEVTIKNHRHFKSSWTDELPLVTRMCAGKTAQVFFDDHQDQQLRFFQARLAGIKHLIFHDNYLTPYHSHLPIRFVGLTPHADFYFEFPPLLARHDPIFAGNKRRWITYVRLK